MFYQPFDHCQSRSRFTYDYGPDVYVSKPLVRLNPLKVANHVHFILEKRRLGETFADRYRHQSMSKGALRALIILNFKIEQALEARRELFASGRSDRAEEMLKLFREINVHREAMCRLYLDEQGNRVCKSK